MEMKDYIITFIVIGFFAFAFISFATNFQTELNAKDNIINDTRISHIYSGMNESLYSSYGDSKEKNATLYEDDLSQKSSVTTTLFGGIVGITKGFTGIANKIFGVIFTPLFDTLNLNRETSKILGAVLTTIFLIVGVLLAWKLLRSGE